jgi:hypothetical protein
MTGMDAIREAIEDAESLDGSQAFNAWMGAAATIAIAHDRTTFLPDSVVRSVLTRALREAEETARGVDWSESDDLERQRHDVIRSRKFKRAFEALYGYEPIVAISERSAYVGTVSHTDGNAEEALEEWLEAEGFRRNAIAYLKHRDRDGEREYETSSWAHRRSVDAAKQLHVRLFDGVDAGTVDLYAHVEPSITKGEEHLGTPDYRTGVCRVQAALEEWVAAADAIEFERSEELPTGTSPKQHDCEDIRGLSDASS